MLLIGWFSFFLCFYEIFLNEKEVFSEWLYLQSCDSC